MMQLLMFLYPPDLLFFSRISIAEDTNGDMGHLTHSCIHNWHFKTPSILNSQPCIFPKKEPVSCLFLTCLLHLKMLPFHEIQDAIWTRSGRPILPMCRASTRLRLPIASPGSAAWA